MRSLLCKADCFWTCYADQAGLEHTEIHLFLLGIKGVCHHSWLDLIRWVGFDPGPVGKYMHCCICLVQLSVVKFLSVSCLLLTGPKTAMHKIFKIKVTIHQYLQRMKQPGDQMSFPSPFLIYPQHLMPCASERTMAVRSVALAKENKQRIRILGWANFAWFCRSVSFCHK